MNPCKILRDPRVNVLRYADKSNLGQVLELSYSKTFLHSIPLDGILSFATSALETLTRSRLNKAFPLCFDSTTTQRNVCACASFNRSMF